MNTYLIALLKCTAGLVLAGAILCQVAMHSGVENGTAYVHVTASDSVEVTVDQEVYQVTSVWEPPIVCSLRPGTHVLRMIRDGQTLYEEEFTVGIGEEVVLTAWERVECAPAEPLCP